MANEVWPNEWLKCERLEVYVRKGLHFSIRAGVTFCKPCLQVANWNSWERGKRTYKRISLSQLRELIVFMREVERAVVREGYSGVFVENVVNEILRRHLHKHGYVVISGKGTAYPCYFKPTSTIIARSEWVRDLQQSIHATQRPAISSFSADATLSRFWVRDQTTKLHLLLKRECVGSALVPQQRITILDVLRESIDAAQDINNWLSLADGREGLARVFKTIESRFRGLTEVAISQEACWRGFRGNDCKWLLDSGFFLERNQVLRGVANKFVKRVK